MSTFTYTDADVGNYYNISQQLSDNGVTDALITLGVDLIVTTTVGSESQCDTAVTNSATDTLQSNKNVRIEEVLVKSVGLLVAGAEATVGGVTGCFEIGETRFDFGFYEGLVEKATRTPASLPAKLQAIDGSLLTFTTLSEVKQLADAASDRIKYIYLDQTNGDLSKGQIGYMIAIKTAVNQAALDAIIDTRT